MWGCVTRSAVGVLAVEDAFDLEVIAVIAEEDAVVLGAQADQWRNDAFKLLGSAFASEV